MTAPSRVMRSASHFGTCPPCSGRSALPDRHPISPQCPSCASTKHSVHALYIDWRVGANARNDTRNRPFGCPARQMHSICRASPRKRGPSAKLQARLALDSRLRGNERSKWRRRSVSGAGMTAAAYLDKLNTDQRRAVTHGGEALHDAAPLLIIAGAGSGKTNTLAHRVAHLIVAGVDPRRMLLLTFSRRAAAEMQRRVERITAQTLGAKAPLMTDALAWSGTFHAIGARLLREYARDIGLGDAF